MEVMDMEDTMEVMEAMEVMDMDDKKSNLLEQKKKLPYVTKIYQPLQIFSVLYS